MTQQNNIFFTRNSLQVQQHRQVEKENNWKKCHTNITLLKKKRKRVTILISDKGDYGAKKKLLQRILPNDKGSIYQEDVGIPNVHTVMYHIMMCLPTMELMSVQWWPYKSFT